MLCYYTQISCVPSPFQANTERQRLADQGRLLALWSESGRIALQQRPATAQEEILLLRSALALGVELAVHRS